MKKTQFVNCNVHLYEERISVYKKKQKKHFVFFILLHCHYHSVAFYFHCHKPNLQKKNNIKNVTLLTHMGICDISNEII